MGTRGEAKMHGRDAVAPLPKTHSKTDKRERFCGRYNYCEINSLLTGGFGVSLNQHEPHCIEISQNYSLVLDY